MAGALEFKGTGKSFFVDGGNIRDIVVDSSAGTVAFLGEGS